VNVPRRSGVVNAAEFVARSVACHVPGGRVMGRCRRSAGRKGHAAEVERLALHGLSLGAWQRFSDTGFRHYEVVRPGFKYNMTDLAAAIGIVQLERAEILSPGP